MKPLSIIFGFLLVTGFWLPGGKSGALIAATTDLDSECGESFLAEEAAASYSANDRHRVGKIMECLASTNQKLFCEVMNRRGDHARRLRSDQDAASLYAKGADLCQENGWPVYRLCSLATRNSDYCEEAIAISSRHFTSSVGEIRFLILLASSIARMACLDEDATDQPVAELAMFRTHHAFGGPSHHFDAYAELMMLYALNGRSGRHELADRKLRAAVSAFCAIRTNDLQMAHAFNAERGLPHAFGVPLNPLGLAVELRSRGLLQQLRKREAICLTERLEALSDAEGVSSALIDSLLKEINMHDSVTSIAAAASDPDVFHDSTDHWIADYALPEEADLKWLLAELFTSHERCEFAANYRSRVTVGGKPENPAPENLMLECLGPLKLTSLIVDKEINLLYLYVEVEPQAHDVDHGRQFMIAVVFSGTMWKLYPPQLWSVP